MTQNRRSRRRRLWPIRRDGRRKADKMSFLDLYLKSIGNKDKKDASNKNESDSSSS